MQKILIIILSSLVLLSTAKASKLSRYFNKQEEKNRAEQQREVQQDMNFSDFSFRLEKRYTDERGERCRDYVFRSRSNPYRHGYYTVCEER
ncbi:hypothetical protein [Legionella spiritensis]|uniref:Uncharacterized protein n=1 Tax=Legionella spiritensis TaxID=452 RepID=A0A0W0YZC9_LEGSP|nr:hypothetical protein [Legionella spiritensis]KTD62261.1 hypothetical protein Lspi_2111 [Legionella spiritensis]SNV28671.1 Uncharacterised protein [Legionella spiritensis]VEG91707.1 Uncharacterised protein [Legionella spiritensis]